MKRRPTVGVTFPVKNPVTMGYFAYLAAADGWSKIADEVVIVDGGSTDNSLQYLRDWVAGRGNIRVIQTPETYWGSGQKCHGLQVNINATIGLKALGTDWGIFVGGDYVPFGIHATRLRDELADCKDQLVVRGERYKMVKGKIEKSPQVLFPQVINLRLARERELNICYGVSNRTRAISDYAHIMNRKTTFIDPVNGTRKVIYGGDIIPPSRIIALSTIVYGHTFFTIEQALAKCRVFDYAFSRYYGLMMSSDLTIRIRNNLFWITGYRAKDNVFQGEHPEEIRRVIAAFYEPGMLGGAIQRAPRWWEKGRKLFLKGLRAQRHLNSYILRARGYRPLKDLHLWVPLDEPDPIPVDVAAVYLDQDRYLPKKYRIRWWDGKQAAELVG